jgi:hypothetical protein
VPAADQGILAAPSSALHDAQTWEPSSRMGRMLMIPIGLIPGPRLLRAHQVSTGVALFFANIIGAAVVIALNVWVIPGSQTPEGDLGTVLLILT